MAVTHEGADRVLERPIIVLGAPRSGTSFISRALGAHPSVAFINEPRFTWRYGNDGKTDLLSAADARPEVQAHVRREFARRVTELGAHRLLEKSPANSLRPGFVREIFPDCRFVHIMRDGIPASLSAAQMWDRSAAGIRNVNPNRKASGRPTRLTERRQELGWRRAPYYAREVVQRAAPTWLRGVTGPPLWGPRLPGLSEMVESMSLLEVTGLQWRACVEIACDFGRQLPSDRYVEVKVEELTEAVMGDLLAFCQLEDDPAPLDYFRDHFSPQRHHPVARDGMDELLRWIGPTREWLGYR